MPETHPKNKGCVIVFSKDRPAQLDLAIRTYYGRCEDAELSDVYVLYKATSAFYESLYRQVKYDFPYLRLVKEKSFALDVLGIVKPYSNVTFVVDDTIFIRPFSIGKAAGVLAENEDIIGVSLRLGKNTSYCYTMDKAQAVPEMQKVGDTGLNSFEWVGADYDFGYPLELSSSVYRTDDLLPLIIQGAFSNPNTMENCMVEIFDSFKRDKPRLVCMDTGAAFSAPLNLVQTVGKNRIGNDEIYSVEAMAHQYSQGMRLSVDHLMPMTPKGCHEEVAPEYKAMGAAVPKISVIVPCYNQAQYLNEAVESVKKQTFQDWELIIVNDGSPDDTRVVADKIIAASDRCEVRAITIDNQGLAMARNAGIRIARGAYILCLDADDRLAPTFLDETHQLLEDHPDIGMAYTDLQQFGGGDQFIQAAEFDPKLLPVGNQLNYCSLYRRGIWEDVGGYNPNLTYGYEDWDFWVGCVERGYAAKRIPGALFEYRIKDESMFTAAMQHDTELRARIVVNHPSLYKNTCVKEARTVLASKEVIRKIPNAPRVSVIIPTCQRPFRLSEALSSLVEQSDQNFEVLVVSDGGIDVRFIVDQFREKLCVRLFEHPENRGVSAARNTGLRFSRGKYVVYLDDDDIFLENHIEVLSEKLVATGGKVAYTDANRAVEVLVDGEYQVQSRDVPYSNDWDNDLILTTNLVPVLCVMHEVDCVMKSGFFDESLKTHEDWDFWIRLSRHFDFVHIKEVTCEFRERRDASSATGSHREDFLRTANLIFEHYKQYAKGKKEVKEQQQIFRRNLEIELGLDPKGFLESLCEKFRRKPKGEDHGLVMKLE